MVEYRFQNSGPSPPDAHRFCSSVSSDLISIFDANLPLYIQIRILSASRQLSPPAGKRSSSLSLLLEVRYRGLIDSGESNLASVLPIPPKRLDPGNSPMAPVSNSIAEVWWAIMASVLQPGWRHRPVRAFVYRIPTGYLQKIGRKAHLLYTLSHMICKIANTISRPISVQSFTQPARLRADGPTSPRSTQGGWLTHDLLQWVWGPEKTGHPWLVHHVRPNS